MGACPEHVRAYPCRISARQKFVALRGVSVLYRQCIDVLEVFIAVIIPCEYG